MFALKILTSILHIKINVNVMHQTNSTWNTEATTNQTT
jgi:hypothetical protein